LRWGKLVYHSGCFLARLSGRAILTVFMLAKQKVIFINKWFVDEKTELLEWIFHRTRMSGQYTLPDCNYSDDRYIWQYLDRGELEGYMTYQMGGIYAGSVNVIGLIVALLLLTGLIYMLFIGKYNEPDRLEYDS